MIIGEICNFGGERVACEIIVHALNSRSAYAFVEAILVVRRRGRRAANRDKRPFFTDTARRAFGGYLCDIIPLRPQRAAVALWMDRVCSMHYWFCDHRSQRTRGANDHGHRILQSEHLSVLL